MLINPSHLASVFLAFRFYAQGNQQMPLFVATPLPLLNQRIERFLPHYFSYLYCPWLRFIGRLRNIPHPKRRINDELLINRMGPRETKYQTSKKKVKRRLTRHIISKIKVRNLLICQMPLHSLLSFMPRWVGALILRGVQETLTTQVFAICVPHLLSYKRRSSLQQYGFSHPRKWMAYCVSNI